MSQMVQHHHGKAGGLFGGGLDNARHFERTVGRDDCRSNPMGLAAPADADYEPHVGSNYFGLNICDKILVQSIGVRSLRCPIRLHSHCDVPAILCDLNMAAAFSASHCSCKENQLSRVSDLGMYTPHSYGVPKNELRAVLQ